MVSLLGEMSSAVARCLALTYCVSLFIPTGQAQHTNRGSENTPGQTL